MGLCTKKLKLDSMSNNEKIEFVFWKFNLNF